MNIPRSLQAGDSASWTDGAWADANGVNYTPAAHGLTYEIRGPSTLTLTASVVSANWLTSITTAQSAALLPGLYTFAAYHTATGVRVTRELGNLTITPNLATQAAGYDGRSDAEKALAACEAAIATGASMVRYQVGDRVIQKSGTAEIMQAISYWRAIVAKEQGTALIAAGMGNPRRLLVKFR